MAQDLKQTMALDAQAVLSQLNKLNQGYKLFNDNIATLANTMGNFNKVGADHVKVLRQIASAQARISKTAPGSTTASAGTPVVQVPSAALNSISSANTKVRELTVSWETLVRVVQTQLIVRALSQLRQAFEDSITTAAEFQRQISLIRTISGPQSFDQVANSVRSISDSFNIPLLQTAAGVYQSLSNQVGDFATSLKFTEEAAKFAKATNSTLADSVDLLSGALRSYGKDTDEVGKVSGIFFTAIDKGRVTASELANAFGRVGPAAKEIGIDLEELAAAAATISDKGIGTSETLSQFRGIVNALTKPTVAMTEALQNLGFASVETAIATRGLDGILEDLASSGDRSASAFAALFPNVRGIGGALSLTGDNLKTFATNIREARQNGEDFANSKYATAIENDAERVSKELNRLGNSLTLEFGQGLLRASASLVNVTQFIAGPNGLNNAVGGLANVAPLAAAGIVTLSAALAVARLRAIGAVGAITPLTAGLVALTAVAAAAPTVLEGVFNSQVRGLTQNATNLKKENDEVLKTQSEFQKKAIEGKRQATREIVRGALERLRPIQVAYNRAQEQARSLNDALVDDTNRSLDRIVSARQQYAQQLESAINDSNGKIIESLERVQSLQDQQSNRRFNFQIAGLGDAQKIDALLSRASSLTTKAEQNLQGAFRSGNEQLRQRALAQFQAAQATATEAQQIAQGLGNRVQEEQVIGRIGGLVQRQAVAEEQINRQTQARQRALEQERDKQEKVTAELRRQSQVVLDNTGLFDEQGKRFSSEQVEKRAEAQGKALRKIAELAFNSSDFRAADALGLGQFVGTIQNDLQNRPVKLAVEVTQAQQQVADGLIVAVSDPRIGQAFIDNLNSVLGRDSSQTVKDIGIGIQDASREFLSLQQQQFAEAERLQKIEAKRAEILTAINTLEKTNIATRRDQTKLQEGLDKAGVGILGAVTGNSTQQLDNLDRMIADLKELAGRPQINADDLNTLRDLFASPELTTGGKFLNQLGPSTEAVKVQLEALAELRNLMLQQQDAGGVDTGRIEQLRGVLQQAQEANIGAQFTEASNGVATAVQPTATILANAQATAAAYLEAARAANSIGTGAVPGKQFGGIGYFANGGMNRGVDRRMTMLADHEMVINSRSTGRFFSQLSAMNAGLNPTYRQSGGIVTNVGDVNITVQAGNRSSPLVGRDLGREFKRELRRRR